MKRMLCTVFKMVAFLLPALLLARPITAWATWYWTHGHSGHVEYEDRIETAPFVLANGLFIGQAPDSWNWVHFAIPTVGDANRGVRYIKVKFCVNPANDSWVSEVHVYNGNTKVKEFAGFWSNGCHELTLDLGGVESFSYGLGVSVQITFGPNGGYDRFAFSAVGADFVSKTSGASLLLLLDE